MSCEQRKKHLNRVMASSMPGALQMLPVVFSNLSASFHVDSKTSAEMVVIPHLSGGIGRCLTLRSVPDAWAASNSNAIHGISICVASDAGDKPHIVSKTKKGNLACDDVCLAWKSRRLCSHVLAVAEEWNLFK